MNLIIPTSYCFDMADIADELKRRRLAAGLTQTELAKSSGVPQTRLSEYELGKRQPTFANMQALSAVLGPFEVRVDDGPSSPPEDDELPSEAMNRALGALVHVHRQTVWTARHLPSANESNSLLLAEARQWLIVSLAGLTDAERKLLDDLDAALREITGVTGLP